MAPFGGIKGVCVSLKGPRDSLKDGEWPIAGPHFSAASPGGAVSNTRFVGFSAALWVERAVGSLATRTAAGYLVFGNSPKERRNAIIELDFSECFTPESYLENTNSRLEGEAHFENRNGPESSNAAPPATQSSIIHLDDTLSLK
jgi:hypothetical protein